MAKRETKREAPTENRSPAIPAAFLDRMRVLLGDEFEPFVSTFELPPRSGLRTNTLKISSEMLTTLAPFTLAPLPWPGATFLVADEAQPGKHPFHAAGLDHLQDPAAMVPAALLAPVPGNRVLDLSAAPGGKATHLACLLDGTGLLVANEVHSQRVRDLSENLERWGVRNVVVMNETPERLAVAFPDYFDRVLVDAPCSGEGMLRRSMAARVEWTPALIHGCALRQATIMASAARMVRPGGLLAYITCTFAPEENEGTVSRFLETHLDFELVQPPPHPGFAPGRPDWLPPAERRPELARAVRLWPQRFPGEGQFIALLRCAGLRVDYQHDEEGSNKIQDVCLGQHSSGRVPRWKPVEAGRERSVAGRTSRGGLDAPRAADVGLYRDFCDEHLTNIPAVEADLAITGTYLYRIPHGLPDLAGYRYLHPGWWLGTFKKNRFEPGHALALALGPADVRRHADLHPDAPEVRAYLRGESLDSAGEDGWVLVTVAGYALGWAKRVHGVLKSHYPRGLRRY